MMQDEKGLDEVIAKFRAQREAQKAAAANAANLKVQAEVNEKIANTNKIVADAEHKKSLSEEAKARLESRAKISEANVDRIKADAELLKAKASNLEEKTKNESDQLKLDLVKAEAAKISMQIKQEEVSVREQKDFATNMDKLRETIEGPVDRLLGSISASTNFDARKKPLTTMVAMGSIGLNNLATQDRTPPIYGIIAKLLGFMATSVSFYTGKGLENLVTKIRNPGVSRDALKLVETDSILREVAQSNRALAIEMAELKIARFKQSTTERFEREKNQFISKENVSKESKESVKTERITKENVVSPKLDDKLILTKLDDIILLVKTISNQYDPETDRERYTAELKWRSDVLERLGSLNVNSNVSDKKSGFGLLEFGALAGVGAYITSIITSITKFLTPLGLLGRGLLTVSVPLALISTALLTLDWKKDILDPIQSIVKTFGQGDVIEGITRTIIMLPELVLKFANRVVASIAGILGFEKTEKELNAYVDRIDIFNSIIKFKEKILTYFDSSLTDFGKLIDSIGMSIKDRIGSIIRDTILILKDFDLSDSIKEFFNALSDKIESMKFWKTNKEYKTNLFRNSQAEIIKQETNKQITTSKFTNQQNNINSSTIDKIETTIQKKQTDSLATLNKNTRELDKKKEERESEKIQQMIEKTTAIITPVTNTQINNNSSNTSIASRPYPRINEYTADRSIFNNRSGDFSGFLMG